MVCRFIACWYRLTRHKPSAASLQEPPRKLESIQRGESCAVQVRSAAVKDDDGEKETNGQSTKDESWKCSRSCDGRSDLLVLGPFIIAGRGSVLRCCCCRE